VGKVRATCYYAKQGYEDGLLMAALCITVVTLFVFYFHLLFLRADTDRHIFITINRLQPKQPMNQLTKRLTKGGIMRELKTSSVPTLNHSCVGNA
jgi:hypothetical protein